jgi:serine/threonine-protein kinase PknG
MSGDGATGPAAACQQPGCAGTIEADGYCARCGLRPGTDAAGAGGTTAAGPAAPAEARVSVPVPTSGGTTG